MYLIAGIDPGTTTGIAILNLNGKLLSLTSSKDMSLDKIIEYLISFGKVSLIAIDVPTSPKIISKLSAQLGSELYLPEEPLSIKEKIELTKEYKTTGAHQRDALASALNAFNHYKNKFRKIENINTNIPIVEIKNLVIRGKSIDDAIKILEEKSDGKKTLKKKSQPQTATTKSKYIPSEYKIIRKLKKDISFLKEEIISKDNEIKRLRRIIKDIKRKYRIELLRDREIHQREQYIKSLEFKITDLNERIIRIEDIKNILKPLVNGDIRGVGIFPDVYDGLTFVKRKPRKNELENMKNKIEIAFVEDIERYKYLNKIGITIADSGVLKEIDGFFYIEKKKLDKIEKIKPEISIERIIRDYRESREGLINR